MVKATCFERDLPVLRAILELDEEPGTFYISDEAIAEKTGLDVATVRQSFKALASLGLSS